MLGPTHPPRDADGDEERAGPGVLQADEEPGVTVEPADQRTDARTHGNKVGLSREEGK